MVADWLWGRREETQVNGGASKQGEGLVSEFRCGKPLSGCPAAIHAGVSCKKLAICTWNPGERGPGWREIWVTHVQAW